MSELKKSDCISIENTLTELGISRNTLNAYMVALDIAKHKFPFDRRGYITRVDLQRLQQLIEEKG